MKSLMVCSLKYGMLDRVASSGLPTVLWWNAVCDGEGRGRIGDVLSVGPLGLELDRHDAKKRDDGRVTDRLSDLIVVVPGEAAH